MPESWKSGRVPKKCGIRAGIGEGSRRVPGKGRIRASVGKVEIWVSIREGSWRVLGKGRIRASAGKVEIRVSTRKVGSGLVLERWDLGEYRKGGIWMNTGEGSR